MFWLEFNVKKMVSAHRQAKLDYRSGKKTSKKPVNPEDPEKLKKEKEKEIKDLDQKIKKLKEGLK